MLINKEGQGGFETFPPRLARRFEGKDMAEGKASDFYIGGGQAEYSEDDMQRIMGLADRQTPEEKSESERSDMALLSGEDPEEEFEPWANQLYGAMIKNARKRAGYSTAQAFSDTIYRRTRVYISRDVLYKIEQGRQKPDIEQFMAINLSLYHAPLPSKVTMPCICPEWISIASNEGEIPLSWRKENTRDLERATGERFNDGVAAGKAAKDDPKLFGYGTAELAK